MVVSTLLDRVYVRMNVRQIGNRETSTPLWLVEPENMEGVAERWSPTTKLPFTNFPLLLRPISVGTDYQGKVLYHHCRSTETTPILTVQSPMSPVSPRSNIGSL